MSKGRVVAKAVWRQELQGMRFVSVQDLHAGPNPALATNLHKKLV